MLDQKLAEAMQRILAKPDERRFPINEARRRLVEDFSLGTKRGASVYFSERDRAEMRTLLEARGYAATLVDMAGMTRGECLDVTPNEKAGREAVKRYRISIKSLANDPLILDGKPIMLPEEAHLDIDWNRIVGKLGHGCVMVVENYESFNRIHEANFRLPVDYRSPLVVYRGDPYESRIDNVLGFLAEAGLPVLAFVDADPSGMIIAANLPGFTGLVVPDLHTLEGQLASPQTGRRDLFLDQYATVQNALDEISQDSPCRPVLNLILRHRSGVVQERWLGRDLCTLAV